MLWLVISISFVFILELLHCFVPINIRTSRKVLRLFITHKGGVKEKLNICVRKRENDKLYRFTSESDAYLKQENGAVYIYYPYKERVYAKNYTLDNDVTVKVKRLKPRFFFTTMVVIVYLLFFLLGKFYIQDEIIPAYISSTYPVTLTHDYSEFINYNAYEGVHNYLVIGSDAREGMTTPHADVIILLSFNENTQKLNVCSILRDIYVSMQDKNTLIIDDLNPSLPNYDLLAENAANTQWFKAKLNYAVNLQYISDSEKYTAEELYAEGLNSLVNCIEYNFRMPIKGVINVSWIEFIKLIDALGGVDIEITEDMLITKIEEDRVYGITPVLNNQNILYNKYDEFEGSGLQHLNGNMALAYVRLRYIVDSTNSDIERTGRIRDFTLKLLEQKGTDFFKLANSDTIAEISTGIYSSLSHEELCELLDKVFSLPSPIDQGTLPYKSHDYEANGVQYIAVDGKNEPRLDIQAQNILCN